MADDKVATSEPTTAFQEYAEGNNKWDGMFEDARAGTLAEHSMTFWQAVSTHRKAIGWAVVVSMAIIMEGYDVVLIGNFYAQPTFAKKYGSYYPGVGYQVSAAWQAGLGDAATVGNFFGALANGYLVDRFGYKRVLLGSLAWTIAAIFLTFFAPNAGVLLAGEFLCGLPWGVFAVMAPGYAADVCPTKLRGYLTVYVNLCWGIGQLISTGVLDSVKDRTDQWAYRLPFAVQWVWPAPLFVAVLFLPESPWWLVRQGRLEDAEKSLKRLTTANIHDDTKRTVAVILHTQATEASIERGASYLDCFRGVNLRRTEIVCVVWAAQVWCGQLINQSYFYEQVGFSSSTSYSLLVGGLGMSCFGTLMSWLLITGLGRRTIYVYGLAWLALLMFIIGFLSLNKSSKGSQWASAILLILYELSYFFTVGPVCYALISEMPSSALRAKSIALSRLSYYVSSIAVNVFQPYMLNPTAGDWGGKTGFLWGGTGALCCLWAAFRLPEPKGRTYEELDLLFARKISARKFKKYHVDPYEQDANGEILVEAKQE